MFTQKYGTRVGRNWRLATVVAALLLFVMLLATDLPAAEAAFGCPATSPTYTVTLPATMDTFVNADNPMAAYGLANFLRVGRMQEGQTALMMFPTIPTVDADFNPATDCIADARLEVFVNNIVGGPANVRVRRPVGPWNNGTTWMTKPPLAGAVYGNLPLALGWNGINATPIVEGWVNGLFADFGIALTNTPVPNYLYNIRSRDFGAGLFAPQLVVTYQKP